MKNRFEIDEEVAALKSLQPVVQEWSAFGENNRDIIAVQVEVLAGRLDLNDIDRKWGEGSADEPSERLHMAAMEAHDWYTGLSDEPAPSDGWQMIAA